MATEGKAPRILIFGAKMDVCGQHHALPFYSRGKGLPYPIHSVGKRNIFCPSGESNPDSSMYHPLLLSLHLLTSQNLTSCLERVFVRFSCLYHKQILNSLTSLAELISRAS